MQTSFFGRKIRLTSSHVHSEEGNAHGKRPMVETPEVDQAFLLEGRAAGSQTTRPERNSD
jgi:hypothetical protein